VSQTPLTASQLFYCRALRLRGSIEALLKIPGGGCTISGQTQQYTLHLYCIYIRTLYSLLPSLPLHHHQKTETNNPSQRYPLVLCVSRDPVSCCLLFLFLSLFCLFCPIQARHIHDRLGLHVRPDVGELFQLQGALLRPCADTSLTELYVHLLHPRSTAL
jgi:hypothetical protein